MCQVIEHVPEYEQRGDCEGVATKVSRVEYGFYEVG